MCMGNSVSHIVIMFIMLKFLSVCEGFCCSLACCFVAGYLPLVTTPCQSAPAPASRRVGVCSGNDIPMITELGKLRSHTWKNHTMRAPFAISANEVMFHLSLFVGWFVPMVMVWRSGNALVLVNEVTVLRARLVLGLLMHVQASTLSQYITSHLGQLSLAIPPWVGAVNTGDGYGH